MNFFQYLLGKKDASIPLLNKYVGGVGRRYSSRTNSEYYRGWVFACVRAISEEVANIEPTLYKYDSRGNREVVLDHPAIDLLYKPNPYLTKYEVFERLQTNNELQGEEYWFIEPDGRGTPLEIYPLVPNAVTPIPDPKNYLSGYKYRLGSDEFTLPKEFMIHFKNLNPMSDIRGYSTIEAVRAAADTDEYAKEYNKTFFENSAVPGVVLEYPGHITEEQKNIAVRSFEDNFRGFKNAYKVAVAHSGLKINKMEMAHADMEFIEQRKFSRDEILAIFRVPQVVLGILEQITYASAKASNYVFALRTIKPKMQKIIDTLNSKYLPLFGDPTLEFDFKNPVQEDVQELITLFQSGLANGYLSPNEARETLGKQPIEGGDQLYIPFNWVPYASLPVKAIQIHPSLKESREKIAAEAAKKVAQAFSQKIQKKEAPAAPTVDEIFKQKGEQKLLEVKVRTTPFEKLFAKKMQGLLDAQLKRAIDKVSGLKGIKVNIPPLLNEEYEVNATIDLFTPLFGDLTEEEGKAAMRSLGLDPNDFTADAPAIREFIKKNTKRFANVATDTTTREIRAMVIAGIEQGESGAEITRRLRDSFTFSKGRSERIARTEVIRGSAAAEKEAWKQSGVVKQIQWYTAPQCDHEECLDLHGTKIALDGVFIPEKDLEYSYDGDITQPPLHPNCQCTLLPIVE